MDSDLGTEWLFLAWPDQVQAQLPVLPVLLFTPLGLMTTGLGSCVGSVTTCRTYRFTGPFLFKLAVPQNHYPPPGLSTNKYTPDFSL